MLVKERKMKCGFESFLWNGLEIKAKIVRRLPQLLIFLFQENSKRERWMCRNANESIAVIVQHHCSKEMRKIQQSLKSGQLLCINDINTVSAIHAQDNWLQDIPRSFPQIKAHLSATTHRRTRLCRLWHWSISICSRSDCSFDQFHSSAKY